MQLAAKLCFDVTFSKVSIEHFNSFDAFGAAVGKGLFESGDRLEAEKIYLYFLHDTFFLVFSFICTRAISALPNYQKSLIFFESIDYQNSYPPYENSHAALKQLFNGFKTFKEEIDFCEEATLPKTWQTQFDKCKSALEDCTLIFLKMQEAIKLADEKNRLLEQIKLNDDLKQIAQDANKIADSSNKIAKSADLTSKFALMVAVVAGGISLAGVYFEYTNNKSLDEKQSPENEKINSVIEKKIEIKPPVSDLIPPTKPDKENSPKLPERLKK